MGKSWWLGVGLLLCAVFFIRLSVIRTFESHAKMVRLFDGRWTPHFPTGTVLMHSGFIVTEAGLVWVVLTRSSDVFWLRAMTCAAVALIGAVATTLSCLQHAPPSIVYHTFWLICVAAGMVLTAVVSAGVDQVRGRRARGPG